MFRTHETHKQGLAHALCVFPDRVQNLPWVPAHQQELRAFAVSEERIHLRCRRLRIRLVRVARVHVRGDDAHVVRCVHDLHRHTSGLLRNVSYANPVR